MDAEIAQLEARLVILRAKKAAAVLRAKRPRVCQCPRCRDGRGQEALTVTLKRPAQRKDGHMAGCNNRHWGFCHCKDRLTEQQIMEM